MKSRLPMLSSLLPRYAAAVLGLALFALPAGLSAHVLVTDGQIGAVLHMDPDDEPVARTPTTFYFEFRDTSGRLDPASCNGVFTVIQNGKVLYSQALFPPGSSNTTIAQVYTFPAMGAYTVEVSGVPTGKTGFQPFVLDYDVRVSHDSLGTVERDDTATWLIVVVAVVVAALVIGVGLLTLRARGKKK